MTDYGLTADFLWKYLKQPATDRALLSREHDTNKTLFNVFVGDDPYYGWSNRYAIFYEKAPTVRPRTWNAKEQEEDLLFEKGSPTFVEEQIRTQGYQIWPVMVIPDRQHKTKKLVQFVGMDEGQTVWMNGQYIKAALHRVKKKDLKDVCFFWTGRALAVKLKTKLIALIMPYKVDEKQIKNASIRVCVSHRYHPQYEGEQNE